MVITIEALKSAIIGLPQDVQAALASWLNLQTMDAWDGEMQNDFSSAGRGHHLVEKVKSQIRAGMFESSAEGKASENE